VTVASAPAAGSVGPHTAERDLVSKEKVWVSSVVVRSQMPT